MSAMIMVMITMMMMIRLIMIVMKITTMMMIIAMTTIIMTLANYSKEEAEQATSKCFRGKVSITWSL